jgi:aryl-alcohol dehydrogenase-like predicted oxidoreductase
MIRLLEYTGGTRDVGLRKPDQVDPIVDAANLELGDDEIARIEGRG